MYRVLACLTNEHDYRLVGLAALVCIAAAFTTFMMYSIAFASPDRRGLGWAALTGANSDCRRLGWAALTGVCAGSGIWATHFVAMLAYRDTLPTYYEPVATMGSLLIAMALAACGFALATRGGRWMVGVGGAVVGIAIGVMHYVGMRALIVPGDLTWDVPLVVASL